MYRCFSSGTTDRAEGLGLGPQAREEPHSPGKGYAATSAPRAEDELYKYRRLSAILRIPSRGPQDCVPGFAVDKEPRFPLWGETRATLDLARVMKW